MSINTLADEVRVRILSNDYINLAEIEAITVPEPASIAFLGLAAGSLLNRRRRVA